MGDSAASTNEFAALDRSGISRFQLKVMFVSGMGFFTDAYDLFVIGIVVNLEQLEKQAYEEAPAKLRVRAARPEVA
jgi:hypothetical protein